MEVCVLGHVTRDIIRKGGAPERTQPGGAAYYAAAALARLGLAVGLVTKLAPPDFDLLDELRKLGIALVAKGSAGTTVFETVYGETGGVREQKALSVADPFDAADLQGISARAVIMDPLTTHDGFAPLMAAAAKAAPMVALDLQGFVRKFLIPGVARSAVEAALAGFAQVAILKADLRETAALTGAATPDAGARALSRFGPREVVVTMGPDGSMVLAEDRIESIPAFEAAGIEDATGAGDSYLAGYVAARLEGRSPREAGLFGAAVAALKLVKPGAFAGSRGEVMEFLARQQA